MIDFLKNYYSQDNMNIVDFHIIIEKNIYMKNKIIKQENIINSLKNDNIILHRENNRLINYKYFLNKKIYSSESNIEIVIEKDIDNNKDIFIDIEKDIEYILI